MAENLCQFYPEIEPYHTGFLDTGDGHQIYYEQSGNPNGIPILFVHGGPRSHSKPKHRQIADHEKYRIILFDQRGCGLSKPCGLLENNDTPHLVADMEALRKHLKIEKKWLLIGGSWGSTLIMNYLAQYAEKVSAVVMWGIFFGSQEELHDLYYPYGLAAKIFPDAYEQFLSILTTEEKSDPFFAYYRITQNSEEPRYKSAFRHWTRWESQLYLLTAESEELEKEMDEDEATGALFTLPLLELHFLKNKCYLTPEEIFSVIRTLNHIPAYIFNGRMDFICPATTAWQLHKIWPNSHLEIIPGEGHPNSGPLMQDALIRTTDLLAEQLK